MSKFLVVALVSLLLAPRQAAAGCPLPEGARAELGVRTDAARAEYLRENLRHDATTSRVWTWTWVGINAALTVSSGAYIFIVPPAQKPAYIVYTATSFLSMLTFFAFPLHVRYPPPPQAGAVSCESLAELEQWMASGAANEAEGQAPLAHLVGLSLAVVPAAVLGLVFHDWINAAIQLGAGVLLTEIPILTEPKRLIAAHHAYRAGTFGGSAPPSLAYVLLPFVASTPGSLSPAITTAGLQLSLRF